MSGPLATNLEAGKGYFYCTCGKSKGGAFCDGSHKGSGMAPIKFSVEKDRQYHICTCKKSENAPYCDGSHVR